jgi:ABC-type transport system involved in multi-copper enzyme maturation permease subunit
VAGPSSPIEPGLNPLSEIQLVTGRELRKSLRSAKGVILAAMTVVGGTGVATLLGWVDRQRREFVRPGVDFHAVQQEAFEKLYGPDIGKLLADAPYSLWLMLAITLWLAPLLIALMSFDAVSSDLQNRTVRYWVVRTRRASYVTGKFLGSWAVLLAVLFGMNVIVWFATAAVVHLSLGSVVTWGLRFFAICVPITAAWCGIATLVGSQTRSPILALLATCLVFFVLWVVRVIAAYRNIDWLGYVYPNAYDVLFLSPRPTDTAWGLLGTGVIAIASVAAAAIAFERRDI